jgi:DNA-3-methyladenine glycosylase II
MSRLIDEIGPYRLELRENHFAALTRAIVGQQLSVTAARTIWSRLEQTTGAVTAESVLDVHSTSLRAIGLSKAKSGYLHDLAAQTRDGSLNLRALDVLSDEEVITALTRIKGIGRWTAEMFLIFSLGRMDVLAADDVGLRRAISLAYDLPNPIPKKQMEAISRAWAPWRSLASLLLWKALDSKILQSANVTFSSSR